MQNSKKNIISIVVSGGMVQSVHSTVDAGIEVDILDFDDIAPSDEERRELDEHFSRLQAEHYPIY